MFRFFLITVFCVFILEFQAQNEILPRVFVEGNTFKIDQEIIVFKGLNASDPDKLEREGHWNTRYFREMAKWGVNLVRFPVHPKAWRERGKEAYIKLLKDGIEMAGNEGMYVTIDWHSIGNLRTGLFQAETYETSEIETFRFWREMAKEFGQDNRVAFFELFNEPTTIGGELGTITWDYWKRINEELIELIRANDAKAIPLVAGFNWAYDLNEIKENPIEAGGIGYVSHPYPQKRKKPWEDKWEEDWGFVADTYPVLLTEIGFCGPEAKGAHIPVIDDGTYPFHILDYCKSKGISFIIWVYDPLWSPMLIKNWNYEHTDAGAIWFKTLQNK